MWTMKSLLRLVDHGERLSSQSNGSEEQRMPPFSDRGASDNPGRPDDRPGPPHDPPGPPFDPPGPPPDRPPKPPKPPKDREVG